MTKNTKIILYTVGGVVTSAVAYFIYSTVVRKKSQTFGDNLDNSATNTSPVNNTNENNTATSVDEFVSGSAVQSRESYPLEAGMYGQKVYVMQSALKSLGKYSGELDGKFGQKTREALKDYFYTACTWINCDISYNNWKEIIDDAKSKGWGLNQAWSEAKSKYL
jgi:hypothetical protein